MNIGELEKSIADLIQDYRRGELLLPLDENHVDRWICQFEKDDREVVLTETKRLLEKSYIGKNSIEKFFDDIWDTEQIVGTNPRATIQNIQFLDIQRKGTSQHRLVGLLEQYYMMTRGVRINVYNSNVNKYIYLDDCMYTGNSVRYDIKGWIEYGQYNENSELYIIFLGLYSANDDYVRSYIEKLCDSKNIKVSIFCMKEYQNNISCYPYDFLWPTEVSGNVYVDRYMDELKREREEKGKKGLDFRKVPYYYTESPLFTSTANRIIFEHALMKAGSYICTLPEEHNQSIRPMGYNYNISLGYGAFFATCYNISNNCPLAFWWGNMRQNGTVFDGWYPLLPRSVN